MGLFDKLLGTTATSPLSKPEAFAGVMLAVIAADGHISDEEAEGFTATINRMQIFRAQSVAEHRAMIDKLFSLLKKSGADALVGRCADTLPQSLREAAFAAAADLIFVDGRIEDEEKTIIEKLQTSLTIPDDLAFQIVRVMEIKNRN